LSATKQIDIRRKFKHVYNKFIVSQDETSPGMIDLDRLNKLPLAIGEERKSDNTTTTSGPLHSGNIHKRRLAILRGIQIVRAVFARCPFNQTVGHVHSTQITESTK